MAAGARPASPPVPAASSPPPRTRAAGSCHPGRPGADWSLPLLLLLRPLPPRRALNHPAPPPPDNRPSRCPALAGARPGHSWTHLSAAASPLAAAAACGRRSLAKRAQRGAGGAAPPPPSGTLPPARLAPTRPRKPRPLPRTAPRNPDRGLNAPRPRTAACGRLFGGALSHGLFLAHEDHDFYPAQPPADVEPRRVEGSRAPLRNGGEEFRSSHPTRPKSLICRFGNTASHTPCRELHRTQITSPTPAPSVLRGNPTLGRGRRRFYFIFNTPHSFLYVEVTDYTTVT